MAHADERRLPVAHVPAHDVAAIGNDGYILRSPDLEPLWAAAREIQAPES